MTFVHQTKEGYTLATGHSPQGFPVWRDDYIGTRVTTYVHWDECLWNPWEQTEGLLEVATCLVSQEEEASWGFCGQRSTEGAQGIPKEGSD